METREEMIDYMQCDISTFAFQNLQDLVINNKNCIYCGLCVSLCPRISLKKNRPTLVDYDPECSLCFKYCPRTYFPANLFERELFNKKTHASPFLGHYQKIVAAQSTDHAILSSTQNGGVVTTLLIHALINGLIDGVFLVDRDDKWFPKPFIARTPEEILSVAGSIYAMAPTLTTYSDAVYKYKIKKLAFVGMPCQIHAARKLQLRPPLSDEYGQITLIIGLFCSSNYSYDLMEDLVQDLMGVSLYNVKKLDVSHGKFIIYLNNGSIKEVPIEMTRKYYWPSCEYCKDYTAEFADISIGSVGAPKDSWNSLIIRTEVGQNLFERALKKNKLNVSNKVDLLKMLKASQKKKHRVTNIKEDIVSAMQLLNVSELEVKIYVTILSLGKANFPTLCDVIKREQKEIYESIQILQQRDWIFSINNTYKAINPTQLVKNEIDKFKKSFENKVNTIKSNALADLQTLFIQNNLMHFRNEELFDIIL